MFQASFIDDIDDIVGPKGDADDLASGPFVTLEEIEAIEAIEAEKGAPSLLCETTYPGPLTPDGLAPTDALMPNEWDLNRYIKQYQPLVRRLAFSLVVKMPSNIEINDLIQAGLIGLMQAVQRYRPAVESSFEAFAVPRIRGAMYDELRNCDDMSRSHRSSERLFNEATSQLEQQFGRPPSIPEVASHLGIPVENCWRIRRDTCYGNPVSIESLRSDDGSHDHIAAFSSLEAEPTVMLEPLQNNDLLSRALDELRAEDRDLIVEHFLKDRLMVDIGRDLGLSGSRISQKLSNALHVLRTKVTHLEFPQLRKKYEESLLKAACANAEKLQRERAETERELSLRKKLSTLAKRKSTRQAARKSRDADLDARLGPLTADMLDIVRW